jgi:uncharacterized protein YecE (DUF72 family)
MLHIGTSGYNYPEWKGPFYPETLAASRMLGYYAERFSTVEINYTFYRMPTDAAVDGWAEGTPDGFSFALKAPRRITHIARLRDDCADTVATFCRLAARLGAKQAPLLFQLPPNFKKDLPRLEGFLRLLPESADAAFEFRHPSWFDDEVFGVLKRTGRALCVADSESSHTPVEVTADFAYFRLRDEGYGPEDLRRWADTIRRHTTTCRDVYVYFKHEARGTGPAFAARLRECLAGHE